MKFSNIHDFIVGKENEYQHPISLLGWNWNLKEHIKQSFYYKHGRLLEGNDITTPVKNITKPILNLQYRAEDIDVKDIVLYVDDPSTYHLSFLIKKYHDDVFVVENDLDTFIDEMNESKVDYGAGLMKKTGNPKPEVVDMQSIAFADQTDIVKGVIGLKFFFNPDELKDMEAKGWGSTANGANATVDELIKLSEEYKVPDNATGIQNSTPGNYIEVYTVDGVLPKSYLDDSDSEDFVRQFQVVGFYKDSDGKSHGVTLFRKKVAKNPFKIIIRDKIYNRGVGYGGAEELFEDQIWTNYSVIHKKDMLDSASKTILKAIGVDMKSRYPNGLKDMENLQVVEMNEGEDLAQIDTFPRNMQLFDNFEKELMEHAQTTASAQDPLLGIPPASGTPFRSLERQVIEGKGIHEYRRGKFAKFLEEVYKDDIIPHIISEITKGATFLSELTTEEMNFVSDAVVENQANKMIKDKILNGEIVDEQEVEFFKQLSREKFIKGGNKRFIEILKGEFKNKAIRVKINVAGKQKDLQLMTDKVVNIWRQIIANPEGFQQVMQIPGMSKSFNDILEFSGMSPVYFTGITNPTLPTAQPQPVAQAPQLETV